MKRLIDRIAANPRHIVVGLLAGLVLLFTVSVGLQIVICLRLARLQESLAGEDEGIPRPIPVVVRGSVDVDEPLFGMDVNLHDHSLGDFEPIPVRIVR